MQGFLKKCIYYEQIWLHDPYNWILHHPIWQRWIQTPVFWLFPIHGGDVKMLLIKCLSFVCFEKVVSNSLGSWEWLQAWSSCLHFLNVGSICVYHNTILYVVPGNWTQSSGHALPTELHSSLKCLSWMVRAPSLNQTFFNFLLCVHSVYVCGPRCIGVIMYVWRQEDNLGCHFSPSTSFE